MGHPVSTDRRTIVEMTDCAENRNMILGGRSQNLDRGEVIFEDP
jgi:hypothetical protein